MKLNRTVLKTKLLNNFIKAVSVSKHQKFKIKSYPHLNVLYYIILCNGFLYWSKNNFIFYWLQKHMKKNNHMIQFHGTVLS